MSGEDARLRLLFHEVESTTEHTRSEKDTMADTLRIAEEINGDHDPVRRAIKTMLINGVRRELQDPGRIKRIAESTIGTTVTLAIQGHVNDCPLKGSIGSVVSFEKGKLRISGQAAWVFAIVAAIVVVGCGITWMQQKNTRRVLENLNRQAHVEVPDRAQ